MKYNIRGLHECVGIFFIGGGKKKGQVCAPSRHRVILVLGLYQIIFNAVLFETLELKKKRRTVKQKLIGGYVSRGFLSIDLCGHFSCVQIAQFLSLKYDTLYNSISLEYHEVRTGGQVSLTMPLFLSQTNGLSIDRKQITRFACVASITTSISSAHMSFSQIPAAERKAHLSFFSLSLFLLAKP